MNTALIITKEVVKAASNYGIGYMAGEVCKMLTPENVNTVTKVCITIGGAAAAGAVGMKAGSYIDEVAEAIDDVAKAVKELKKEEKPKEEKIKNTVVDIIEDVEKKEEKPKKTNKKATKKETKES